MLLIDKTKSLFDKTKSLFTGGKEKVIDLSILNRDSFKLIAADVIESFNKETNCCLEIKRSVSKKKGCGH